MCGIVGYVGNNKAEEKLIRLLKNLEYRGYDSSGIGVLCKNKIKITRAEGKICNLEKKIIFQSDASCGIGHTRWATHGGATENNAHPHISSDKSWAVVHNGIIENYAVLKKELINKSTEFSSDTDTEVIAQLLGKSLKKGLKALIEVCSQLSGSYALACINKNYPSTIFLAKNKSPLYVCKVNNECYMASDPICFSKISKDYFSLDDNEYCKATNKSLNFYDRNGKIIIKKAIKMDSNIDILCEHNYPYHMIKEINEIPTALKRVAEVYKENHIFAKLNKKILQKIKRIKIVACGTAYHSGLVGAKYLEKNLKIESSAHIASEFRYSDPIIDKNTLMIFVSQSGETADTLSALDNAKQKGCFSVAITNVGYSTITKKADLVLPVCAGPEIAVASTKAYVCQCAVFYILAKYIKSVIKGIKYTPKKEIDIVLKNIYIPTDDEIKNICNFIKETNNMFFLGRDMDYYTAQEGCLKLKEITYINANAYAAGELKHGVLALVEDGTPIVVVATEERLLEKTLNGAHEAAARGGKIIIVSQFDIPSEKLHGIAYQIKLPALKEDFMPMIAIVPLQKLAYNVCISKGFNPDQPRNLAKSVTVE